MSDVAMIGLFVFVLGLIVGSFLNVCIVRMPHEQSVVKPGSHCPKCKKPISWYQNIPLFSYIFLGGKCSSCGEKISIRYFLVELLTGVIFVGFYYYFGMTPILWPYLFMVACFIVAIFVDFEHRIIPDEISVGGMWAGLILSGIVPSLHNLSKGEVQIGQTLMWWMVGVIVFFMFLSFVQDKLNSKKEIKAVEADQSVDNTGDETFSLYIAIGVLLVIHLIIRFLIPMFGIGLPYAWEASLNGINSSILGIMIGGGFVYLLAIFGDWLFKKESMGGGDIKLLAMMGAFLGWERAILAFFIAPFFGAVFGIIEKIRTGDTTIAYGPFLVLGALIALFYGDWILNYLTAGYYLPNNY